jgi:Tol biopolymer transport system component
MTERKEKGSSRYELSREEASSLYDRLAHQARRRQRARSLKPVLVVGTSLLVALSSFYWVNLVFGSGNAAPPAAGAGQSPANTLLIIYGGSEGGVYAIGADGGNPQQLTSGSTDEDIAPSPDGQRIALVRPGGIFVMNTDGSGMTQLTDDGSDNSPSWSPEGTTIVFSREMPGETREVQLFTVPSVGGDISQLTNESSLQKYNPAWSPDGSLIAFAGGAQSNDGSETIQLYTVRSDGSDVTLVGGDEVSQPAWAPDGSEIAFAGKGSLSVIRPDGSDLRQIYSANFVFSPSWSPDGSELAFIAGDQVSNIAGFLIGASGQNLHEVTDQTSSTLDIAWLP